MDKIHETENLDQFAENMKQLAQDYFSLQKRIARLTLIRYLAKAGGGIMDGVIRFILLTAVLVFAAITGAFFLSEQLKTYAGGFGLMTLILLMISILIHLARKVLFVNPIIHRLVKKLHAETDLKPEEYEDNNSNQ
ncbi:hypothetical protein LZZ85_18550 [Terrimonas sp. NA20]|uniref:Phage holin family protein n=1 Tax=Terrimonas ginsenosidimutans TaxID=2908004 RepID=A0ABS9KVF7_9BACT|nr:hypothetical protein [Terrimonas ginsenosidimutans]MCG2616306.1 hypothetical protein [Terrimonas ginsenosidimutans]